MPRVGPGYLLYVAPKGDGDSVWKLENDRPTELWSSPGMQITGAPVVSRDGRRIAFVAGRDRKTSLFVANADGTNARAIATSLQLQGAPAWTPGGRSVTVSAIADGIPRLFDVPVEGGSPTRLVDEHALDPVWSPDGRLLAYSGPDIGTTFQVKAVTADGSPASFRPVTLSRGARHLSFSPGGRSLIVLRGDISHKDLWEIELETGRERQLSRFASDFVVRDFDISPDGRHVVVEQLRERSDVVLIERPHR
jgi:Tol biopolymer transport system component